MYYGLDYKRDNSLESGPAWIGKPGLWMQKRPYNSNKYKRKIIELYTYLANKTKNSL